jgi:CBS domain-containing protein
MSIEDVIDMGQSIRTTSPQMTVREAVTDMCKWHVRALIVGDASDPIGILCERDVLERVIAAGLDPATTTVEQVMTSPLVCLPASSNAEEALEYMRNHRLHQVPVLGDEALIGMVSATDLRRWALESRDSEIRALRSYVTGR